MPSTTTTATPMSALDAAFAGIETRDVPFVHATILDFDRPIAVEALRAHVDAALAGMVRYRQRIERHWLRSAWVVDDRFRIDDHIQIASVAAPGGPRELDELTAHLLATELPAAHSPWRLWTVHGLAGERGAVIALFHHSLIDGIAGFRLLAYVLGAGAAEPEAPAAPSRRSVPEKLALVRELVAWPTVTALVRLLRDGLRPAAKIGLNPRRTGRVRTVASHTIELDAVRQIGRALGATHNDVVLAAVAGALRDTLCRRAIDPARFHDVRAMVPVGRHAAGDRELAGNRVVLLLAALPVDEPDPVERLRRITATTRELKSSRTAAGGDLLIALSEATTPALMVGVLRLALRLRAFNVIVTNVPGPPAQLSLLGARLTRIVPIVNLWPHQSLGVAVASYAGTLSIGIQADRNVIPDARQFRDDLAAALEALRDAATRKPSAPRPAVDDLSRVRVMQVRQP